MKTALQVRRFDATGMEITRVGLGAWAMGGGGWAYSWGEQDDRQSVRTIQHSVERGLNWIDSAAVYGYGHSEEVVGRALRELPRDERPLIFTKCGMRWYEEDRLREPLRNLQPASIRFELEASLRRLGLEQVDLYQFHWPDETGTPVEESWSEMARLMDEGKVAAIGVSNFDVDLLERCERIRHVNSLQPHFSLIERTAAATVLPWAREHDTAVIVYSPMQSGLLTGSFSQGRLAAMSPEDWRRRHPDFNPPRFERNLALAGELRPIAERRGVSVGAVAIAWTLAWRAVTGAIVGARSPEQVDGWIAAAELELDADDLAHITEALQRTKAGEGPVAPV